MYHVFFDVLTKFRIVFLSIKIRKIVWPWTLLSLNFEFQHEFNPLASTQYNYDIKTQIMPWFFKNLLLYTQQQCSATPCAECVRRRYAHAEHACCACVCTVFEKCCFARKHACARVCTRYFEDYHNFFNFLSSSRLAWL